MCLYTRCIQMYGPIQNKMYMWGPINTNYSKSPLKCSTICSMEWLRLVGSIRVQVSFAKEPYKRDAILEKRPTI